MTKNKVSVFITSYNQKEYLKEAIESVLQQTRMPDEIIIADDDSSDGSKDLIRKYDDSYPDLIHPLFQPQNVGIPRNKNAAYRATTGDLVTYLDGDDRFLPNKIETDLSTLESSPDADIACSNFFFIDESGKRIKKWQGADHHVPTGDVLVDVLARQFPGRILFRNEMVRRDHLERVDYMDTKFDMYHDWELRIRLAKECLLAYNPKITSEYRSSSKGVSSNKVPVHFHECSSIYEKHRHTILSLPDDEKNVVRQNLESWIGKMAWSSVYGYLEKNRLLKSLEYTLEAIKYYPSGVNLKVCVGSLLPSIITQFLASDSGSGEEVSINE